MTWLDIFVAIICIMAFLRGLKTGLIMQVASLGGIILGAIFAGRIAEIIYPYLDGKIGDSENVTGAASYLIGFVLILFAVSLIGKLTHSLANAIFLGSINRIVGAVFCTAKWILIMSILLNILIQFDLGKSLIKDKVRDQSHTYPILINIAQTIIPYLRFDDFTPSPKTDNPPPQVISV